MALDATQQSPAHHSQPCTATASLGQTVRKASDFEPLPGHPTMNLITQSGSTPLRIYVDMDGVMCDIAAAYREVWTDNPEIKFPQSVPGIFLGLDPIAGAKDSVNRLRQDNRFDIWVLSAPSVRNPHCYTEKRLWIEQHFDYQFAKRLILATEKGLLKGDVLIDDFASGKGQDRFEGLLIQFGTPQYPDWESVESALYGLAEQAEA